MYTKLIIFFLISLWCTNSLAQSSQSVFTHLTIEDGLSQSSVYSILQDRSGLMWFGTEDGLNMYDGHTFRVYRNESDNPSSLSNNNIRVIFEDTFGSLWIGTWGGGLNLFDPKSNSFTRYQYDSRNSNSLSGDRIWSIYEDYTGVLWVGTYGSGLNRFDRKSNSFIRYENKPQNPISLSGNFVLSIYEDRSGELWIGTNNGLNLFERESNSFKHYQYDPENPNSLSGKSITSIREDHSGMLWIGTGGGGLNLFDRQNNSFKRYKNDLKNTSSLSNNIVWTICKDRSGSFWVGTWGGGLNLFNRQNNSFERFQHDAQNSNSLMGDFVISIYEDRSGVLWVGTLSSGLNILNRESNSIRYYQQTLQIPKSLLGNNVNCIVEAQSGMLWISTFGEGLSCFDRNGKSFKRYHNDPMNPKSLSHNNVHCIYEDRSGELWIGTEEGLNVFNRQNAFFKSYQHSSKDPKSLSYNTVYSIHEDRSGFLWVGTYRGGLNLLDRRTDSFISYQHNSKSPNSLSNNSVTCIYDDHTGALWIGTENGLNLFNRQDHSFIRYQQDPENSNSLSNNSINCIYEDLSGAMWIGTGGGGLNRLDRSTGSFKHFRENDGLLNDVVYGILEDGSGRIWISTVKGISRLDPETGEFRNFDVSDGLSSNEFNFNGYCKTRDGLMYFGSINGITAFHPDSIKDDPFIPPIVITDLLLFNKPVEVGANYNGFVLPQSILTSNEVTFSYQENVFTFDFSALCYVNPEKNKYAYRLEGFDKEWIYTDAKRHFATYTNLDPGTYMFQVKGSNHDFVWNNEGRTLKVVITPPWWKTIWAYIGYAFVFIGLLYTIRRFEKNREKLKHQAELEHVEAEKLREIDQLKSHFFANISHEFRTPLTLILGPIQKWLGKADPIFSLHGRADETSGTLKELRSVIISRDKEIRKDLTIAERNTRQLLNLVNQLLDLSKIDAAKMNLRATKGNIVSFVKWITMSFESRTEQKGINLQFISEQGEIELYFDRDKMTKILTNLLSNAFKFTGEGGSITVSITHLPFVNGVREVEAAVIIVKDTGIGIREEELPKLFDRFYQVDSSHTREHEGTGIGLALTKELVEIHHGKIKVKSKVGEGSEFILELPVGKKHLSNNEFIEEKETGDAIYLKKYDHPPASGEMHSSNITSANSSSKITQNYIEINGEKEIILIVEDNADVRSYIKDSLGDGYLVEEASNGEQGIEKAKEIIPDLIISDVMMPKMDGNELTRRIKTDERTSHIPVILLTAKSAQENKLEGLETGADDYLTKPFDPKELTVRITNLINLRKKLYEKFSGENIISRKVGKKLSSIDEKFLNKSLEIVENHLPEEDFSIEEFGKEVGMSRQQLNRKIRALTGKTASLYLRSIRLLKAKSMIEEKKGNISEIAYSVGFSSPAYFSACFKEEFGYPPSNIVS